MIGKASFIFLTNVSYLLGNSTITGDYLAMTPVPLPLGTTIAYITVTHENAMMIGSDGKLYGFGRNDGEYLLLVFNIVGKVLGVGDAAVRYNITAADTTEAGNRVFTQVSISTVHGLAYATDGSLFTWGSDYAARGRFDVTGDYPSMINMGGKTVVYVSAGYRTGGGNSLVVTSDGKVHAFGNNQDGLNSFVILTKIGQLCVGDKSSRATPTPISEVSIDQGTFFVKAYVGAYVSFLLTDNGEVYGCGSSTSYVHYE